VVDLFEIEMNTKLMHRILIVAVLAALIGMPANFQATPAPAPEPNIGVAGYFATDKAQRSRVVQAAIVIDIPSGYHINSSRPLESYLIATELKIDGSNGARVGTIGYPPAKMRTFKFSKKSLSVYENKAILRFTVTVPATYQGNELVLKAHLRYQSCNDEVCFPPKNQDVNMGIGVVGANDRVQRTNGWVFGGR
jgi:DsbC/DsbD-like thiol-disulfide interchange protein